MRTLYILFTIFIAKSFAIGADIATNTTNALRFFLICEKPFSGGRHIDTPAFPKLGFISNAPSFVLTRLKKVSTNDVTSVSRLHMGGKVEVTTNTRPAVSIAMFPEDAKNFAELTQQNIERQVLIMLNDQPLMAPMIVAPIEAGEVELWWKNLAFPRKVVEAIQNMVKGE